MTLHSPLQVAERVLQTLEHRPAGLFSDFDGTLSVIQPIPADSVPWPGAREALQRLNSLVEQCAIVTGRAAQDALAMLDLPEIKVIGNHGLEMIDAGTHTVHPVGAQTQEAIGLAVADITIAITQATDIQGMVFEDKRYSASIHFRNTPDPAEIDRHLRPIVHQVAEKHGLRITDGKLIYELRPLEVVSKGTAVASLIQNHNLASAIFIGDDVTDTDAFIAIHELEIEGLAIGVESIETPRAIREESDVILVGVSEVVEMLTLVADYLEKGT